MDILPALQRDSLAIVYADHAAEDEISHVIAELALCGPVTVLDGGNRFQAYLIARLLRQRTQDVRSTANRLFIRRAFTCYQMLALLENTPALPQPYLVLDLLATFYDENVRLHETVRLLEACLTQINRLCRLAPVAITVGHPILPERAFLVEKVCANANRLFIEEIPVSQGTQPAMF